MSVRWRARAPFTIHGSSMRLKMLRLRGIKFALLVLFAYLGSTLLTLIIKKGMEPQEVYSAPVPLEALLGMGMKITQGDADGNLAAAAEAAAAHLAGSNQNAPLGANDVGMQRGLKEVGDDGNPVVGIPSLGGGQQYTGAPIVMEQQQQQQQGPLVTLEVPEAPELPPAADPTPVPLAVGGDGSGGQNVSAGEEPKEQQPTTGNETGVLKFEPDSGETAQEANNPEEVVGYDGGNPADNPMRYATTETSYGDSGATAETRFIKGEMVDDPNVKTILFWNSLFTSADYRFGVGHDPFVANNCPVSNCQTTTDRSYLDSADVVMFHGPWIDEHGPLPDHRPAGQLYALVQTEPQAIVSKQVLSRYRGRFNLTISHRYKSDVRLSYGWVIKSLRPWLSKLRNGVFVAAKSKPRDVVWMVSHCETPGRRELYVQELQKYIEVDVYGQCGTYTCTSKSETCMAMYEAKYKFFLALENDACTDYISEKLFRTFDVDIIPIVYGGGNYSREAAPHSVINILDYPNPKDLGDYLHYLANNDTAYNEYFLWKSKYEVENFRRTIYAKVFCSLCEILNDSSYKYRSEEYREIDTWWNTDNCESNRMNRLRAEGHW